MKQKWIALLLASAMMLSLLGASAAAVDEKQSEAANEVKTEDATAQEAPAVQDAEGTLTFESIEKRVKEKNYTALALAENIAILDELDYKKLENQMRDGLNEISDAQWQLTTGGSVSSALTAYNAQIAALPPEAQAQSGFANGADMVLAKAFDALSSGFAKSMDAQLQAQYDALEEQLDDIKNGKLQKTNEGVKLQLETAQSQMVMGAQTLYITLLSLERSDDALTRSLEALDRTITELELRYQMGQISELQLSQVKSGRTQLLSGQQTLRMNMDLLRMQLNAMIGEELSAKLTLQPLAAVTQEALAAMNLTGDYAEAEKASYEVYAAKKTRDDAEEAYKDAVEEYGEKSKKMEFAQAKHTWQAAQYTYDAAMQSFSLKFRTLYAQVKDYAQVLDAARAALTLEQREYEVALLKYQQGTLSHNALLDAENELLDAQDTVSGAESDLYTAYNNYQWAVTYGILN